MHIDGLALAAGILASIALVALVLSIASLRRRSAELVRRMRKDVAAPTTEAAAEGGSLLVRSLAPLGRLAKPATSEEMGRLRRDLGRAGLRGARAAEVLLAAKVLLAFAGLALLFAWSQARTRPGAPAPLLGIVLFAAGFYAPNLWLRARIAARQLSIERGLADTLDLLVTCIEAGLGLDSALQRVTVETKLSYPVLGRELEQTFLEIQAGIPRVEAFRRLADRTGVGELKSLAATLTQTEMFGTSVGVALRIQADGIRVRRSQRAEERAAYVSVKMTVPLIVCVLPALIAIIVGPAIVRVVEQGGLFGRGH